MQTSAFEYKCRRCGEIHTEPFDRKTGRHISRDGGIMPSPRYLDLDWAKPAQDYYEAHDCEDGGHGISDLIGITPPREDGE